MTFSISPTSRIQAVIFDLDDTLIDWSGQAIHWDEFTQPRNEAVYRYLIALGHAIPLTSVQFGERLRDLSIASWQTAKQTWRGVNFGQVWQGLLTELGLDPACINLNALLQVYNWEPFPGVILFEDTLAVLEALRQQGYALGLITNSSHPMWMRDIELQYYGLIDYFPARITSGDTGYMKPHPAIFWRMLGQLGLEPRQAVFVGDRPANDIAGANEVGMVSVLMKPHNQERDLNGVCPHHTITQLTELLPILAQLNEGL